MKQETVHILLAGKDPTSFAGFKRELAKDQRLRVTKVYSAEHTQQIIRNDSVDVIVIDDELQDEAGLQFVRKVVADYPFINCALVSPLYPEEFHEQTEGLGLFMQLPVNPGTGDAEEMLALLDTLKQLPKPSETNREEPC